LSVESDAEPFKSVDLSPYLDNTDDQALSIDSAGTWYTITLENGGSVNVSKADVSGGDNWGSQVVEADFGLSGNGTTGNELEVDSALVATLYALKDTAAAIRSESPINTDDQVLSIDSLGNWYTVTLESGGTISFSKDTDTQLSTEEVQDITGGMLTGNTETLIAVTYQDGDGTIDFVVEDDLSLYDNTTSGFISAEVDGSVTNEIQAVDTLVLSGTTLGISLSSDGVPQKTVDLSSLQDGTGTDDQKIDTFAIVSNVLRLSVESDAEPFKSVDLSPYLDNTDTQDLSIDSAGDWYTVSLVNGGAVNIKKDTDTQLTEEQVEDFVGGMLTGNTETLITVDYQDGDGTIDFVVEDDLSLYDNTTSGFISAEVDEIGRAHV
jgi:hypothetical protein